MIVVSIQMKRVTRFGVQKKIMNVMKLVKNAQMMKVILLITTVYPVHTTIPIILI